MASKRQLPPSGDGAGPPRPSKCLRSTPCSSQNTTGLTRQDLEALLAEKDREIEKLHAENKELNDILSTFQATSEPAGDGRYEIRILGTIEDRVYTMESVEGKDGKPLKVEILYDGNKITWGPFSSAKFEIVVVKGDVYDHEGWSADEFQGSLVEAGKQVGSILAGNCRSKLSDGEAVLSGLKFKISSHWAKWRLGIRVWVDYNVRVLEAISEPFQVLDRRSKANKKPQTLLLTDGVERLKKVGSKRVSNFKENNIHTIKDFLQLYHENPTHLREILGKISESNWKTMIKHAEECDVGTNLYNNMETSIDDAVSQSDQAAGVQNRQTVDIHMISSKSDDQMSDTETDADQNVRPDHNTAQQYYSIQDQTAGVQDRQPVGIDMISFDSDDQMLDTETDADQNVRPDHNTAQHYNSIQGQSAGVQERQPVNAYMISSYYDDPLPDRIDVGPNDRSDHNAAQHYNSIQDQTAGVQDRQLVDAYKSSSDSDGLSVTETDACPNTGPDHNTAEHDNCIYLNIRTTYFESLGLECSFSSQHAPACSPLDSAADDQWMNKLAADRAHSLLRGCAAALLLFMHVRRARLVRLLKKLVVRGMLVNKFGKKLLLARSVSAHNLAS